MPLAHSSPSTFQKLIILKFHSRGFVRQLKHLILFENIFLTKVWTLIKFKKLLLKHILKFILK